MMLGGRRDRMLVNMQLEEFLNETSSDSPAPGGGSVCALVGALGAALCSMVGELTIGKEEGEDRARLETMINACHSMMDELKAGVDADTGAFNKVISAYKMPKANDEEKKARSAAIQLALKEASELPYKTAKLCMDVMNMAFDMLKVGNRNASSDASVAALLGYAALNGALYNVKINLNSIKDTAYTAEMKQKVDYLTLQSDSLLAAIKAKSAEIIG